MNGRLACAIRALGLSLVLALVSIRSDAATHIVRPDGTGDFQTIQSALDASVSGDEIVLANGTFRGPSNRDLNFHGKGLLLRSESGDPETCIVDAEYDGRGFWFNQGEDQNARVQGLTILNGVAGGGWNEGCGGAVYCGAVSPVISDCVFEHCSADYGGGISIIYGSPRLDDCSFHECSTALGGDLSGGAVYVFGGSVSLERSQLVFNWSTRGGAIYAIGGSQIRAVDCTIQQALGSGAALCCDYGVTVEMSGCTLSFNLWDDAQVVLTRESSFVADHTLIAFGDGDQVAVSCDPTSTATLSCSDVFGHGEGDWVGCLAGQDAQDDNLHLDPIFCSMDDLDPRLRSDSPCAAENNPACGQIGSLGVACDVPTATARTTWGRIKSSFR